MDTRQGDFKKFKVKNKEACKAHFALMDVKRKAFNDKQVAKEGRKKEAELKKKEKDDAAAIPDGFAKGQNKKLKFGDYVEEVQGDGDIDKTIKKVDNKLKSIEKKEKKEKQKLKAEKRKSEEKKKEMDPKKLKKIEKEKARRKRKKEAEAGGVTTEGAKVEKAVVDFTEEADDDEGNEAPPPSKKSKGKAKKHRSVEAA